LFTIPLLGFSPLLNQNIIINSPLRIIINPIVPNKAATKIFDEPEVLELSELFAVALSITVVVMILDFTSVIVDVTPSDVMIVVSKIGVCTSPSSVSAGEGGVVTSGS